MAISRDDLERQQLRASTPRQRRDPDEERTPADARTAAEFFDGRLEEVLAQNETVIGQVAGPLLKANPNDFSHALFDEDRPSTLTDGRSDVSTLPGRTEGSPALNESGRSPSRVSTNAYAIGEVASPKASIVDNVLSANVLRTTGAVVSGATPQGVSNANGVGHGDAAHVETPEITAAHGGERGVTVQRPVRSSGTRDHGPKADLPNRKMQVVDYLAGQKPVATAPGPKMEVRDFGTGTLKPVLPTQEVRRPRQLDLPYSGHTVVVLTGTLPTDPFTNRDLALLSLVKDREAQGDQMIVAALAELRQNDRYNAKLIDTLIDATTDRFTGATKLSLLPKEWGVEELRALVSQSAPPVTRVVIPGDHPDRLPQLIGNAKMAFGLDVKVIVDFTGTNLSQNRPTTAYYNPATDEVVRNELGKALIHASGVIVGSPADAKLIREGVRPAAKSWRDLTGRDPELIEEGSRIGVVNRLKQGQIIGSAPLPQEVADRHARELAEVMQVPVRELEVIRTVRTEFVADGATIGESTEKTRTLSRDGVRQQQSSTQTDIGVTGPDFGQSLS